MGRRKGPKITIAESSPVRASLEQIGRTFDPSVSKNCLQALVAEPPNIDRKTVEPISLIPDERHCVEMLREIRWPTGVECVKCGSSEVVRDGIRRARYQLYRCTSCTSYFTDRSATPFGGSKLPLRVWFLTAFLMQFDFSVRRLAEVAGVSYRNFYYLVKKLRESDYRDAITMKLNRTVSVDETFVSEILNARKIALRPLESKEPLRTKTIRNRARTTHPTISS